MNRRNLFAALIGLCFISLPVWAQGNDNSMTLTVKTVEMEEDTPRVLSVTAVDGKGGEVSFHGYPGKWFTNATVESVSVNGRVKSKTTTMNGSVVSSESILMDGSKVLCKFKVKGKIYPIDVGPGNNLVVKKGSDGKYALLPEKTAKLSPPPKKE